MRKCSLSLVFFLIFSGSLFSQTNRIDKWAAAYTPTATVLSPLPSYGIQPGAEYRISSRLSLLTEITFAANGKKDSSFANRKYFRVKPELRYNFESRCRWLGSYLGWQLSYAFRKWNDLSGGSYFTKTGYEDTAISYSHATITSPIFTSSIQIGSIMNVSDHFAIDLFMGMGTRTIFTHYSDVQNSSKQLVVRPTCRMAPYIPAAYRINHTLTRFHMNSGIRFLYYF